MGTKGYCSFAFRLFAVLMVAGSSAAIAQTTGTRQVIASFNMDNNPGWTTEGQWEYGQPQGLGGDPSSGYTGPNVYGYNLAGVYPNSMPRYNLTTTAIDCSGHTNVVLRFRRWLGIESSSFDHAYVDVSRNGSSWSPVWTHTGGSIQDSAWLDVSYDISAVADGQETVFIRWGMGTTDSSVTYCGWNIDDVELTGYSVIRLDMLPEEDYTVHAHIGDPVIPSSKVYTISNSSSSVVNWSASANQNWISVSPAGPGALYPGESLGLTVSLNTSAYDFTLGSHTGAVTVLHVNENEAVVRNVSVNIYDPPQLPADPVYVSPASNAEDLPVDPVLDWEHESGTVPPSPLVNTTSTYTVYFGASATGLVQVASGLTNTMYDPGQLEPDTTYFWQIAASNGVGATTGPLWNFTTWVSGPLDHFEWSAIESNQHVSVPFDVSVAAKDSFGDTVVGFNEAVDIGGYTQVSDGEHAMLGNVVHQNSGTASTISRGLRFRVDEDITITHFRTYRGTNVCLWTDGGELLYEAAVTNAQGSWSETGLSDPITLHSGQVYRVSSEGGTYYRLYDYTPRVFGHGQILSSCYSTGGFPSSTYSTYTELIDFRYAVGHQDQVAIFPSNAVAFVDGVWTGQIAVAEYVEDAFLRAEHTDGIRGDSGTFWADYIGEFSLVLPDNVEEGDGTLPNAGRLTVSSAPATNLVVNLEFEQGAKASAPAEVVIPAGETNVLFDLTVLDDALLDGSTTSLLHAVSFGYRSTSTILPVHDNESTVLSLSLPSTTYEGAGSIAGALLAGAAPDVDVVVHLVSNHPEKIGSGSVVLPAGQTFASFTLPVYDNDFIDGIQTATITAHVENWQSGHASVFVFDNETSGLDLQLPASLTEGDGTVTNAGTVSIPAIASADVNVLLTCSDTGEMIVPAYVTIPAGTNQVSFDVAVVDDADTDGTTSVSVLAQAPGYIPDSATVSIADNDPHHLSVSGATDVALFGAATITVSARTVDDALLGTFSGEVSLSANGDRGPVAITPASLGNMNNGTVSGNVSFNSLGDDVALIASAGGVEGTSTVFNVLGPQLAIAPANLENTLVVAGQTAEQTLIVSNAGNANLEYEIPDDGEGTSPTIQNLVLNGDFEAGNTNFTSTYAYHSVPEAGRFFIGGNSKTWNANFATALMDHTSGSGLMLMADGKASATAVWEQNVVVAAGTEYVFSAWVASLDSRALPILEFLVNGQIVGTIQTENATWKKFIGTWSATTSGPVVLSIRDTRTEWLGNDFAIDDIDFREASGLIAYYPFNGDAADESGNGHDGTVSGATLTADRFGNADSAYLFDGVNDYIEVPDSTDLRLSGTDFSISAWVYETARNPSYQDAIIAKRGSGNFNGWFHSLLGTAKGTDAGKIFYQLSGGDNPSATGSSVVPLSAWTHVVTTYDLAAQTLRLYVNGVLDFETPNIPSPNAATTANLFIGRDSITASYVFHGAIDDVRIYNRALPEAEIQALYADDGSGGGGDTDPGMAVQYRFDGDATDSSGNGADGIVEGAVPTEDRDGNPNSAYAFDEGAYIRTTAATDSVDIVGQISMSGWINPSQFETKAGGSGTMRTIMRKLSALSFYGYAFSVTTDGRLAFDSGLSIVPNTHVTASGMDPLPTNVWSHVAMTYDGAQVLFYVDGVLADTRPYSQPLQSGPAATLSIGRLSYESASDYFYGSMDELRLHGSVLSAAEVAAQYSGTELPSGPWFSANPAAGTIPPGGSETITVTFTAEGLTAGAFVPGVLALLSNDPFAATNAIPLSMLVLPPAPVMDAEPESTYGDSNTVSWSAVDGPVQYQVEVAEATDSAALQQSGWLIATNHTFSGLATNATYYYRSRASIEHSTIPYAGPWSDWVWSTQLPVLVDSDADGLPDWWEQMYFGGPTNANPLADSDGDGQSDYDEFIAGMDPTNSASCFAIHDAAVPTNGQFVIYWDSVTGRVYSVHWKPSLTNAFEPMATDIFYPQDSYTDTVHQAEDSGFYKVEVELE